MDVFDYFYIILGILVLISSIAYGFWGAESDSEVF